ncbi:MAG: hypothetical protein ACK42G_01400 [Candidatus Kapaibacteriota bacterium]
MYLQRSYRHNRLQATIHVEVNNSLNRLELNGNYPLQCHQRKMCIVVNVIM